jgi:Ca2+/H+ antiporter, TMEM165/GDT1 family
MLLEWTRIGPSVTAAFLGSLVEFIEALTIVIAVGTVRGWRSAMLGTSMGVLFLAALVSLLGPALSLIPISLLQFAVGVLLVLFGMRWLRKAVLREAGVIPLHDEAQVYAEQTEALGGGKRPAAVVSWDAIAIATAFKAVVLEGLEVVFIVIAVGAVGHMLIPASAGAVAAGILVVLLGLTLHRPLAQVPENTLKFAVGILISAFGVFWVGEGLAFDWPGSDLSILGLIVGFLFISLIMVPLARYQSAEKLAPPQLEKES